MKILFVVNVDWFFISHRLPLAEEALRRGLDVYLITKDTGYFENLSTYGIKCFNLDFERSGKNPFKEFLLVIKLYNFYKSINPDIIHHVTLKPSIYGTLAAKTMKNNFRIINAVSGLGYTFTANRVSISKIILKIIMKIAYSSKKVNFIFQNPDDKYLYKKLGFLNNNNNVIIRGAGVDENKFLLKKRKTTKDINVVLLARMLKDKGVFEFISAANLLKDQFKNKIKFILVGGIDEFNPAGISANQLNSLCDGEYILWVGHQKNVMDIYENADIVCLPSYREGLPKSLVEAMAKGCPIITTDAIGCRECVIDNVNGFLVPIGDHQLLAEKIKFLATNDNIRTEMGMQSRKIMLDEMSLSKVVKMTFDFYFQA
jgi:glycosyltransferase involved in cell wall biosynthesis